MVCILQEALTNVRKHAAANHVRVRIGQMQVANQYEYLLMEVIDDGVGFVDNENGKRSFGLQTMHERALAVGGELAVHSTPGQGTSIMCRLPCLVEEKLRKQNLALQ